MFPDKFNEFGNWLEKEIWEIHKYVKIKQHTPEEPTGQRRSHEGN